MKKNKEKYKQYCLDNKNKLNEKNRVYVMNKRKTNPLFKLKCTIRNIIGKAITKNGYSKTTKTYNILGCTYEELLIHVETQWSLPHNIDVNGNIWMTWNNYGTPKDGIYELNKTWDIDHKIGLNTANNEEELLKLNHYSNLQPLCSFTNRFIKK